MIEAPNPTAETPTPNPSSEAPPAPAPAKEGAAPASAEFYKEWKDDDLKTNPSIHKFKTTEELARSYVNLEKRLGDKPEAYVRIPDDPADAEGSKAMWQKLGGPETVEGYKIDYTNATDQDKAVVGDFVKLMHEKGPFPPAVVAMAVEFFRSKVAEQDAADLAAATQQTADAKAFLQKELGEAYGQYEKEIGNLIDTVGGKELRAELDGHAFGDSPKLTMFLKKIVDRLAESGATSDGSRANLGERKFTPEQAGARARELEAHPAFRDASHAQHREIVKQRNDMLRAADPSLQKQDA